MKRWVSGVCAMSWVLCVTSIAGADDTSMASDKAELQVLKARLEKLEQKVADQEATSSGATPGNAVLQMPGGLHGVQMSGFVDVSGHYNFNAPQSSSTTRLNTLRVFDTQANTFMINNAELILQKPVSADSPVGFKTTLMFGTDSEVTGSVTTGLGSTTDEVDLKDAYAEYLVPIGEGLDVIAGRFATMHGAEVIESINDWNITRSFLFGFAIPFTHTGVRMTYPLASWLSATLGVSNGWDVVDDNNQGKTIETSVTVTPISNGSLTFNYMGGPEQANNNSNQRNLIDIVASYQPIDPLQLKLNFDYGTEQKGVLISRDMATWVGLAGYARYAVNEWWALASRFEWFHDSDGVRTAFNPAAVSTNAINGVSGTDLNLWEITLTNEFKLNKHLIGRLEYRHDQASEHVFARGDLGEDTLGGRRPYQDTISMEFIAPF